MKLEVGRVARPHGLRGEVVVDPITDQLDRFQVGAVFDSESGPLTVAQCRPFQRRFLVFFEGCTTREQAEALHAKVLYADALTDRDELFVHELIGCEVLDQHGTNHGRVVSVEANPAADLLVLANGALVPMNFVTSVSDGLIAVQVPDGLFSLGE